MRTLRYFFWLAHRDPLPFSILILKNRPCVCLCLGVLNCKDREIFNEAHTAISDVYAQDDAPQAIRSLSLHRAVGRPWVLPSGSAAALMILLLPFLPDAKAFAPNECQRPLLWSVGANLLVSRRGPLGTLCWV